MKKTLTLLLALAMIFALCACGQSADTPAQAEAPTQADTTAEAPAVVNDGKPVYINADASDLTGTVRFYTCFAGEVGTDALIAEFNKYYPNVTVEATTYKNSADGNVGLDAAMMAEEVDVILSFGVSNTAKRWTNGMFMDLTDKLAADNLDLVTEWGTDAYKYNDRVYVFPSGGLSCYVAINLDKWNAAGLGELPTEWTYDEYLEACRAMTERDANGNVTVYGGTDFNQIDYWTYSIRQSKGYNAFYKEDGTSDFDNPLWASVLQREVDAENEGIWYSKATFLADSTKSRDKILAGEIASGIESIITRYITTSDMNFKIGYAPYPVNAAGETNYMGGAIPNSFVGVCSNAQDPDAAYAFAKFCATYGNKYMFCAGHACTWTGVDPEEILTVVFGSVEEASKKIDVDSFISCVVAAGEPAYAEDYIVAFSEIQSLVEEYTKYVINGEMTVDEAMTNLKTLADQAIANAS